MSTIEIKPAKTDAEIKEIAVLANEIWHEHFTDIIGEAQVDYMVDKFQSYPSLKEQIGNGYEYFKVYKDQVFVGYTGILQEGDSLFLSKLYIKKDSRGQHVSTEVFHYLSALCKERNIGKIWLTCNKHNSNTLNIYKHWGFTITKEQKADIGNGFYMDDYILEYPVYLCCS